MKRREDPRFITGTGRYVDDLHAHGMLHAAFVRSTEAHAAITSIDTSEAAAHPGVVGVFTAEDLGFEGGIPMVWAPPGVEINTPDHMPLKSGEVKCVGDPVAVVVGRDKYGVIDAAEKVIVEYDPKPASSTRRRRSRTARHWSGISSAPTRPTSGRSPAATSTRRWPRPTWCSSTRIANHRTAGAAIEPRGAIAQPHGDGITLRSSTQIPHITRFILSGVLGISEHDLRVVAPDVGGGFGSKLNTYGEEAVLVRPRPQAQAAGEVDRDPVGEHGLHPPRPRPGRPHHDGREVRRDGHRGAGEDRRRPRRLLQQILTPFIPELGFPVAGGCYAFDAIDLHFTGVFTNKFATDAIRGAGRPEMTHWVEVMMDRLALEVGSDPVEIRRKNFIPKDQFPYETPLGIVYDSGDYEGTLDKMLEMLDLDGFRSEQEELRGKGVHRGVGLSTYTEVCGLAPSRAVGPQGVGLQAAFYESATVRVHPTGSATVYSGASPHGQGLDTSYAQIAADRLGVDPEKVEVLHGDTNQGPWGWGTYGSRSLAVGGEAIARASERVQAKAKKICAAMLEAAPEDIELADGTYRVKGQPDKTMSMAEIAGAAYIPPQELPTEIEPGLEETAFYDPENFVFPFGAHACVVDVDVDTGKVEVVRWVAVDDCGPAINPMLIDGQVHGGVAHGIGQALYEQVVYDAEGQLVTGSFVDYALPTAAELPSFETDRTETPSPVNSLGVKGVGEAGTIAASPAVLNAVVDALRPLGVDYIDMPLTPMRVWQAIDAAKGDGAGPAASEQGRELDEHGEGAAGSGPTSPEEGGGS